MTPETIFDRDLRRPCLAVHPGWRRRIRSSAQTPLNERVLVVYNSNGADSLNVAKYYMAERKIPQANRCKITVSSID